jgi:AhpD family alkylhydroperoxidase
VADQSSVDIGIYLLWPEGSRLWNQFSSRVLRAGLDPRLTNLVLLRASQINRCAYCLDMHTRDALQSGDDSRRLSTLEAWRDTAWFSESERAALALTETLTDMSNRPELDDAAIERARALFSEEDFFKLVLLIVVINGWNRINRCGHVRPT